MRRPDLQQPVPARDDPAPWVVVRQPRPPVVEPSAWPRYLAMLAVLLFLLAGEASSSRIKGWVIDFLDLRHAAVDMGDRNGLIGPGRAR